LQQVDEIEEYWNGHYLSAMEATWRILGFHVMKKDPAVTCLPVHGELTPYHQQYQQWTTTNSKSKLLHYFC
jgi:hypothetical protein